MINNNDNQLLRTVVTRELETITLYEQMMAQAKNDDLRRFLAHAVSEEKEHVAEALQLLGQLDPEQGKELQEDHSSHFDEESQGARALERMMGNPVVSAEALDGDVGGSDEGSAAEAAAVISSSEAEQGQPQSSDLPNQLVSTPMGRVPASANLSEGTVGNLRGT